MTKEDSLNEVQGNGYDTVVISDGKIPSGAEALFVRIDPTNPSIVEFAFAYPLFGFTQDDFFNLSYLEFEAIKGGPKDPANYLWNDEYTKSEAGSPYGGVGGLSEFGTQGLGNIYELDTLRGAGLSPPPPPVIPEPSSMLLLGSGLMGLSKFWRRRRRQL